jgi:hypothetical protein
LTSENPVVAALPGQGWTACYTSPTGEDHYFHRQVVAFLVYRDGTIRPVDVQGVAPVDAPDFAYLAEPDPDPEPFDWSALKDDHRR